MYQKMKGFCRWLRVEEVRMKGVERRLSGERTDLDYLRYRRVQGPEMQE
jgi:hypothetical protein